MADSKTTYTRYFGPVKQKLADMISEEGFEVESFTEPIGWWRTSQADIDFRWTANVYRPDGSNKSFTIGAFSTMTECTKKGFTITGNTSFSADFIVQAKPQAVKLKSSPKGEGFSPIPRNGH